MTTDPFTLTIIQEHLQSAAIETFVRLGRASKSPIIYEVLDYACALLTPDGELIAEAQGVPGFTGVLPFAVQSITEKFGARNLRPGDIFATNDPYSGGGTHLSDVCLVGPIFYRDELVAFAANKGHWTEVGGMAPGSWTTDATEIYQEGLQLPAIRVYDAGEPSRAVLDIIAANSRLPDMTLSDLFAGVASIRVGEARVRTLCERYGVAALRASIRQLLQQGEIVARNALRQLPPGIYEADGYMDDDGLSEDPIPIRVRVTIDDESFTADFSGSSPQVRGPINGTRARLYSSARMIFKAITESQYPNNGGCFRPVKVICPDGTIFTAQRPAPVSTYWETGAAAVDLLWQALYPIAPAKLSVGHFLSICGTNLSGKRADGSLFILTEPQAGGWGATSERDGPKCSRRPGQRRDVQHPRRGLRNALSLARRPIRAEYRARGRGALPGRARPRARLPPPMPHRPGDNDLRPPPLPALGHGRRRPGLAKWRSHHPRRRRSARPMARKADTLPIAKGRCRAYHHRAAAAVMAMRWSAPSPPSKRI